MRERETEMRKEREREDAETFKERAAVTALKANVEAAICTIML